MDKSLFIKYLEEGETCSSCLKEIESGYMVFGKEGDNKIICQNCKDTNRLNKKMSLTVKEIESGWAGLFKAILYGKNQRLYEVVGRKNIANCAKILTDKELDYYITATNIEVIYK